MAKNAAIVSMSTHFGTYPKTYGRREAWHGGTYSDQYGRTSLRFTTMFTG